MRTALPFGTGVTYTQLTAIRNPRYQSDGPDLVAEVMQCLADLHEQVETTVVARLNDVSMALSNLNPAWFNFSVTCFHAMLKHALTGETIGVVNDLQHSFQETAATLVEAPS